MTPDEIKQTWVQVPLRWRYVRRGDLIITSAGAPWLVVAEPEWGAQLTITAIGKAGTPRPGAVDPDDFATVLMQVAHVDAITMLHSELGARLMDTREADRIEYEAWISGVSA